MDDERGAVLVGAAGVGKSRLLGEVCELGEASGRRVVRIGATRSLAALPFGAFAGVLLGELDTGTPLDVLQRALRSLAGDRPLDEVVLAIDDAHLLDDASAGLVLLAAQAGARVVVTIREHEWCAEAITRLWKDDFAARCEILPLDQAQVGTLLETVLGGPVDAHTQYRLYDATRGNLLFLRELIRHALDTGSLCERGGVWSWQGRGHDVPAVRDLVRTRIATGVATVDELLALLAIGEPLGAAVVDRLVPADALESAEDDALVSWQWFGARRELRLVHPLYAEVIRESLGPRRRALLSRELAEAIVATGLRRRDDRLRVVVLNLAAGLGSPPAELAAAARVVGARADFALAEQLARASIAAGGTTSSTLLLANILRMQNKQDEVIELLGRELPPDANAHDVASAALVMAITLYFGLGRYEEADACLERGIERLGGSGASLKLLGQRSQILFFAGRAPESIEVGRAILDDPRSDQVARLHAYSGLLPSAAVCGRNQEVDAGMAEAMDLSFKVGSELNVFVTGAPIVASFLTKLFGRGLAEFDPLIAMLHNDALKRVDDPYRGFWALILGRSALAQGRIPEATRRLRDAAALLRVRDIGHSLGWALAGLAQALGVADDGPGATAVMCELDAVHLEALHHFDVDIELGRAWAASARGEQTLARQIARATGRAHIADGRLPLGAMALHDVIRLGGAPQSVCDDLDAAATGCDSDVAAAFAQHAHGLIERDGDLLRETADAFAATGWLLHAAECAAGASRIAAEQGLKVRQRDAALAAWEFAKSCGQAMTPLLSAIAGRSALATLTRREQEVALMAARGMSKREIADTLILSARTVGNHINHLYAKLGISSREELRAAIDVSGAT